MLVADILFIALLRTLKSIPSSQDCVFLNLCFIKLELVKQFKFFLGLVERLKYQKKATFTAHSNSSLSSFFLAALCLARHSEGEVQLPQLSTSSPQPEMGSTEVLLPTNNFQALLHPHFQMRTQVLTGKAGCAASQVPTKVEQSLDPHTQSNPDQALLCPRDSLKGESPSSQFASEGV